MPPPPGFVPIRFTLPWPHDSLPLPTDGAFADVLDRVALLSLDASLGAETSTLEFAGSLAFLGELLVDIPGLDGMQLAFNSSGGLTLLSVGATLGESQVQIRLLDLSVALRLASDAFIAMRRDGDHFVKDMTPVGELRPITVALENIDLQLTFASGFSFDLLDAPEITLTPVGFGDSGFVLEVAAMRLHFDDSSDPPAGFEPGWRGVFIPNATLHFPPVIQGLPSGISLENATIGSGGFTGSASVTWRRDSSGHLEVSLLGLGLRLYEVQLAFEQNIPKSGAVESALKMPMFDDWLGLDLGFQPDGSFTAKLKAFESGSLIRLRQPELLEFTVADISLEVNGEDLTVETKGSVKPLIGGFDWPSFEIEKLSVDQDGTFDIQGGWIDLPESFSLDFHAFKIDIDEIGLGKNEETAREWFGFSGGIRLIEGIPLSASVDGLQVSWDPANPPTSSDPLRGVQVTLEGVAVHLEIPGTLKLEGSVRYREIPRPPDELLRPADTLNESGSTAKQAGVFGHVFTGSILLDITALKTQVAGELLIGELTQYDYDGDGALVIGETFPAFYIVLSAQLPSAIPLGATGTGLYGLAGLFGMHVAPNRQLVEGESEAWYEWYKADRGDQSAYSVTKVVKWTPRFDNYAFGAGLTIGTIYDDGFTINVGALVAILLPGPVIMIEGKANLLKQRGESGKSAEGALYALIVFDGLAETFQMNVDINYTLEDVITVGGGMEAFFDFKDNSRWYVYIGRKDPESKRIRAEVISIISASAYFMVDPKAIVFGAAAGLDLKLEYQPLVIRLILRIAFEIGLFFKKPQLAGFVELYGEISILIFGWGIKLILQTLLEGSAPQPWWIHGLARVAVSLPFPLPSFEAQVEFTWGESEQPARVPLLLGASVIHPKELGRSWELPTELELAPVVPVDAIAVLSLGKPLSQVSTQRNLDDGSLEWFDYETVEGWDFRYQLTRVTLRTIESNTIVAQGPLDAHRPWLNPMGRILTDAGPSDSPEAPSVAAPQVQLWGYSPLDALSPGAQSHYRDPCEESSGKPERNCVHWRNAPVGLEYGRVFTYQGLSFSTSWARVIRTGIEDRFLACDTIDIRFPEPVTEVVVLCSGLGGASGRLHGSEVWNEPFSGGELKVPNTIDSLRLKLASRGALVPPEFGLFVLEICYVTQRSNDRIPDGGDIANADRAGQIDEPILQPNTLYALEVVAERGERIVGDAEFSVPPSEVATFYFRTGAAPGLNLTTPEIETDVNLTDEVRNAHQAIDFRDGKLNELSSYVRRTTPMHGAPSFYGGYDVVVSFDVPYLTALFDGALRLRISDQNGNVMVDHASRWVDGILPLITPSLEAFLRAPREQSCMGAAKPWSPHHPRELLCSLPKTLRRERLYKAEVLVEGKVLYSFTFSLSRFRDFHDHFAPGWDSSSSAAYTPPVRTGISLAAPVFVDLSSYGSLLTAWQTARQRLGATLSVGEHDSGVSLDQALADLTTTRAKLDDFMQERFAALDAAAQPSFEDLGLGHRPRPPVLELISVAQGTDVIYLLDSPEPVDRDRLSITDIEAGAPVYPIWDRDGTRAFLFNSSRANGSFGSGTATLELKWALGGFAAPDVAPLYRQGVLDLDPAIESVRWLIGPT